MQDTIRKDAIREIKIAQKAFPANERRWWGYGEDPDPHHNQQVKDGIQQVIDILSGEIPYSGDFRARLQGLIRAKIYMLKQNIPPMDKCRITNELLGISNAVNIYHGVTLSWKDYEIEEKQEELNEINAEQHFNNIQNEQYSSQNSLPENV